MIQTLIAAGIAPTQAKMFADPLKAAMELHAIDTPQKQAAFIAQAAYESNKFTRLEENLFYTTEKAARAAFGVRVLPRLSELLRNPQAMANFAYANRNGNGSEASGDGWKYRGRGLFQLTGRRNYAEAANAIGRDYLNSPKLVAEPSDACLTAAWYWQANGCNEAMDGKDFDATTRIINGPAMLHAAQRRTLFNATVRALA